MPRNEIIAGLDIGSTNVRLVVGQRVGQDDNLHIVGAAEVKSVGINKGVISSIEDAVSCISACLEKAERMVGQPIQDVWAGISGSHIISQSSKGVVAVSRADGEIREDDVIRAIEAARTVSTPPNYEILHVIPKSFTVDRQAGIKDPIGMTGIRVEVDTQIILGLASQIRNLTKAIYRTTVNIEDLVLSILATSEAVLTQRQKELGSVVVNIGGGNTSLVVFEEGDILHTAVLPIGSEHITSDLAIGLRVSIDTAEKVKLEHGAALAKGLTKRDEIDIGELEGEESNMVSKRYVSEIIGARAEEILEKVDNELKKIDRSGKLPAGVILTGGGAKLPGVVDLAKTKLRLPASIGEPINITSAVDKVNDLGFTTAVGLVLWGNQVTQQQGGGSWQQMLSVSTVKKRAEGLFRKGKNIFKSFRSK
ncbi:MAG: cell division protein FtsA [Candidatus Buchananbacteria bacterium CG10_big_fil_rev_8_21_14_0_10_42_9]|uniref:Cell division protein FtsA n=1 Tax=Candidatus Buchananbacteria bacterium CG10_big_fil_rev_8_21_14_0_10_42_9 TaxID=1974526 RepID=A0A2H0W1X6_9BACT|nr:MAG: cell division protein FtsA [Candidatus Buchananbacteria bacterium CG10_big_fil_rev_8_21_14_0_10_42_9]